MPGILVCSNFVISVCMFIVLKALLISSATVIVHVGGAIWLNTLATVLFNVCSSVTSVEFCTHVAYHYVCSLLCKEKGFSPVSAITERKGGPKGPMWLRCLIFSLSGPCELLCLFCFIASWTCVVVSVML